MSSEREIDTGAAFETGSVTINGDSYRMYSNDSDEYPSVSTIVRSRPTPEKDKSIEGWRNWLKGQPDRPHPDDVLQYKGYRGTLAHYKALDPLARYELAGDDEFEAYEGLKGWEYRHEDALSQAEDDVEWFVEQFRQFAEEWSIARFEDGEVVDTHVRSVEQAVVEETIAYAGRYDLLYDHPDRGTIMADLKSSNAKSVDDLFEKKFPDYGMQLAAYARASKFDVDEIQTIWISPDSRESAVITEAEMPQTRSEYEARFTELAESLHETLP